MGFNALRGEPHFLSNLDEGEFSRNLKRNRCNGQNRGPQPLEVSIKYLAVVSGQVLSFLRFDAFCFRVFGSAALQKRSGTCSNASGVFCCIEFACGNGRDHWRIDKIQHFGCFTVLGVLLPALR